MNTHADKTHENKSQSVANTVSQRQSSGESTFQFIDNRPEAIAQRKLQEMVTNNLRAKQAAQLQAMADNYTGQQQHPIQKKKNNTGLPDNLKTGIENLSGYSMDDVKVHYNSDKPAQFQAHAYAQGTDIHLGSGQEKHLPHEAWHVVQQAHGRVQPTIQMKNSVPVNDDQGLEREADVMGAKALAPAVQLAGVLAAASNAATVVDNRPEAVATRDRMESLQSLFVLPRTPPAALDGTVVQARWIQIPEIGLIKTEYLTEKQLHDLLDTHRTTNNAVANFLEEALKNKEFRQDEKKGEEDEGRRSQRGTKRQEPEAEVKKRARKEQQVLGVSQSSEIKGQHTDALSTLALLLHNEFSESQCNDYLSSRTLPEGVKLDTQGTTAAGFDGNRYLLARQGRLTKEPSFFTNLLNILELPVAPVVVISAKDLLLMEATGLHGESYIVQWLFIEFMKAQGIKPRVLDTSKDQDQELLQLFLLTIMRRLQIGASQGACWDCAGFLNSVLVAHGKVRDTPSSMWVHPLTGTAYSSEHNPDRNEVKKEGKTKKPHSVRTFNIQNYQPTPASTGFGMNFPPEVLNAAINGELAVGVVFEINGVKYRLAHNTETGQIALFIALRGG